MKKHWGKTLEAPLCVLLGNLILAFTVVAFVSPKGIIMGGATGIGLTISHYLPINLSMVIFIINGIFFIFGAVILGKKFALMTIVSSITYPIFLALIQRIPRIDELTDSYFLATIYGGVLLGVGIGLIVRVGSSTGGTDGLALIFNKFTHVSVAMLLYVIDFSVLLLQVIFSDTEQILYGILTLVLCTLVLNRVTLLGKSQIQLFVISPKYEEIRKSLLKKIDVGVTMVAIESGFDKNEMKGVLCVINNRKLYAINELIREIDPQAFVTISRINEVRGRGFSLERVKSENRE
ncbi:YitT family protein [Ohessyouella blattaphilus]|uniref:YitT family protein n=1 Tax=Ohessyouella blattaphilus TaxID=2949333 RepID=A0ABT1EIW1_9FIRM|nr:YitT family protein [Ohessyouella blattaphilus]MCP1110639.1 YitT family protein [Ohessyouella blattaphilus]MCR8564033.1 YitT family protein [Ohessyouella blattaphilus]